MTTTNFNTTLLNIQDNMHSFALSLTANHDEAQDLVQDTTLRVLKNQNRFVNDVNFKGWVLTVMRNIFINNYHRSMRIQELVDQNMEYHYLSTPGEAAPNPHDMVRLKEIHASIDNLSETLRLPFKMYLAGYKYHEIATKVGVPLGTVKSRIFLARKELREALEDHV